MFDTFTTISYAVAAGAIGFAMALALTQLGQRGDRDFFYCMLLAVLLVHVLGQLLIVSKTYELVPHLVGLDLSLKTLLGPSVYFYTRALISPQPVRFGGMDWLAVCGPVLVILASIPFASLSATEKLALVDPVTRNPEHYRAAVFTCTAALLVFLFLTVFYLARALRLQIFHRRQVMEQFANIERQSLDWLRTILMVFAGAWMFFAVKQILWLTGLSVPAFNLTLALTECVAIAALAFLGVRQPDLLFDGRPERDVAERRPILSEERLERTARKLVGALNTDKLYADSTLSLRKLSDVTGVTKNHISETLSQQLGMNFFDFVNKHRAEEAKRLLSETELSILDIGLEVGFNSRSTFNSAFKKHVGSPPSVYRNSVRLAA